MWPGLREGRPDLGAAPGHRGGRGCGGGPSPARRRRVAGVAGDSRSGDLWTKGKPRHGALFLEKDPDPWEPWHYAFGNSNGTFGSNPIGAQGVKP